MFTLEPVTLTGRFVRMEPVGPEHVKGLFEAARPPEIWRWFPMKLDSEEGVAGLVARAEAELAAGLSLSFATRVLSEDLIVGSSSYLNVSPENDRLEIGFTWITPPWQRTAVNTEAKLLMLGRKLFYRVLRMVADDEVVLDMAEFSLITREVRDAIVADRTSFPFIRASIGRVGFRRNGISYKRHPRVGGKTHFRPRGLVDFAVSGILASSTLFLRLPIFVLPFWLVAVSLSHLPGPPAPAPGWTLP